jgi:hypothetical protein
MVSSASRVEKAMASYKFGVYILTYPGDYHLSCILVRSIQHVSPDLPIMIIPGEGFDLNDHPFDVPVMPIPTGFWAEIGYQDRDFWAFQGPFETFLYLDADTIVVKSLDDLAKRVVRQQGDFIYVQPWMNDEQWRSVIRDPTHPEHNKYLQEVRSEVGPASLDTFDPDHDCYAHRNFNSGAFASRRFAIKESNLASLNEAERKFYRDVLGIEEWNWKSSKLFFRDQGRLNYLVDKLSIPVFPLEPDLVCRAGASASAFQVSFDEVEKNSPDFHFIHWMGAKSPTPSYFCNGPLFRLYANLWSYVGSRTGRYVDPGYRHLPECTGYSLWRHYYQRSHGPMPVGERLHWTWRDTRRVAKLIVRWLRLLVRSS